MSDFIQLIPGHTRRIGDQVRRRDEPKMYTGTFKQRYANEFKWRPVSLIGHKILQSDLVVDEFRREVALD